MAFNIPSLRTIVLGFIAAFFGLQIVSLVISTLFPTIPLFRGGPAVLVMILGVAIMALYILGTKYDLLDIKKNLIFVALIFGLLIAAYYFLPQYLPQIFVIDPGVSQAIKQTMASIFGG